MSNGPTGVKSNKESSSAESIIDLRPTEQKLRRQYTYSQAVYSPEVEHMSPVLKETFPENAYDEQIYEMSFSVLWSDTNVTNKEHLLVIYSRRNTGSEWKLTGRTEFTTVKEKRSVFVVTTPFRIDEESTENSFYKFSLQTNLKHNSEVLGYAECRKDQLSLCSENGVPGTLTMDLKYIISEQLLADKTVGSISIFIEKILRIPRSAGLPLLKVFSSPVQQAYQLVNDTQTHLRVHECLVESPFISSLPCKLLGLFIIEERDIIQRLESLDFRYTANTDLSEEFISAMKNLQCAQIDRHRDLLEYYADVFHELNHKLQSKIISGEGDFRRSPEKKNEELQWLPLNCCIQKMRVEEIEQAKFSSYSVVTVGAPCAHSFIFQDKLEQSLVDVYQTSYYTGYLDHTIQNLQSDVESLTHAMERCIQIIIEQVHNDSVGDPSFKKQLSELKFLADEIRKYTLGFLDTTMSQEGVVINDSVIDTLCEEVDLISYQLNEESLPSLVELTNSLEETEKNMDATRASLSECLDQIRSHNSHIRTRLFSLIDYYFLSIDKQHTQNIVGRKRDDISLSQAITAIATGFVCMIDECLETLNPFKSDKHQYLWSLFWERLEKVGFLCQFESLLSPSGYEHGMLLDTYKALHEVEQSVKIGFHAIHDDFKIDQALDIFGYHGSIVISVGIPEIYFAKINPSLQNGNHISVIPIIFTQGINEQQAYANMMGDLKLQDKINAESYEQYLLYLAKYKHWWQTKSTPDSYTDYWAQVDQITTNIKTEIDSVNHSFLMKAWRIKTTASPVILQLASELTLLVGSYPQPDTYAKSSQEHNVSNSRDLEPHAAAYFMLPRCCMRYTMCKSAKDRTSMSVTLEQAKILKNRHHLSEESYDKILKAMREECGVRIANIERNLKLGLWKVEDRPIDEIEENPSEIIKLTLQTIPNSLVTNEYSDPNRGEVGKYAFNFWQLYFFPEEYRPVSRVIGNFQS